MRVVIISDAESLALLDSLELEKFQAEAQFQGTTPESIAENMHRRFHYVVTRWLQSVGAESHRR